MRDAIKALSEIFELYGEPVDNNRLALILKSLKHLEESFILRVLEDMKYTRTSPYPPKFSDFISHAKKILLENYPDANSAWGLIIENVSKGYTGYMALPDNVKEAIDLTCGWDALRNTNNLLYYRSAFIATYESIIEKEVECQLKP